MKVPQFKPWVGDEEYRAIAECFDINWITEGPKSKEFLNRLLELTGAKYGVLAPNGTLAIYLALSAMGIGPGDEVIVPDFTFVASANAVLMTGATPVFVDVDDTTFQIDVDKADDLITPATKALMPVHIYGTAVNMDKVMAFASRHGLMICEDAAQAIGVHYNGKHAGSFGETGTFSFFADKTLTTAEGGLVITDDEDIHLKLMYLRNQGRKDRGTFIHPEIGYNFRMTDMQSAVGLVQLGKLDQIKTRKAHILDRFRQGLDGISGIRLLGPEKGADFIPFRVGLLCDNAESLMRHMEENEVETRSFFYPLHRQPAFAEIMQKAAAGGAKVDDAAFPNTVYAYEHGVCLPSFPELKDEQIDYICGLIRAYYG